MTTYIVKTSAGILLRTGDRKSAERRANERGGKVLQIPTTR